MHRGRFRDAPIDRRAMLPRCANGFGSPALLGGRAYGRTGGIGGGLATLGIKNP